MMNEDLIEAHKGIEITLGKKPSKPRPIDTKKFFLQKSKSKSKSKSL